MKLRYLITWPTSLLLAGIVVGLLTPAMQAWAQGTFAVDVPKYAGRASGTQPILTPCSRHVGDYRKLGFLENNIDQWPDTYHKRVDSVVEEYLKPSELDCSAEDFGDFLKPGPELKSLAADLPQWSSGTPISRLDTGRVLLEYLRVYECGLMEFGEFVQFDTTREEYKKHAEVPLFTLFMSGLMTESSLRTEIIQTEQLIARKSLHRVLSLLGAFDRLRPLSSELECLQRFSLDVRNITALSAETSACMPRIWNAKDTLRDIQQE